MPRQRAPVVMYPVAVVRHGSVLPVVIILAEVVVVVAVAVLHLMR